MNASPAPTVFTFFKPLSTRSIVGIEITSPFFPKIQPFSPLVTSTPRSQIPDIKEHMQEYLKFLYNQLYNLLLLPRALLEAHGCTLNQTLLSKPATSEPATFR